MELISDCRVHSGLPPEEGITPGEKRHKNRQIRTRRGLSMWVIVKRPDGKVEEREYLADQEFQIGDVLEDGSIVFDVPYPEDTDDDMVEPDMFDDD